MVTIRQINVSLDGHSDFNTTYGTDSWTEPGWLGSIGFYDNSASDLFKVNIDLSGSDWVIRSLSVGSPQDSVLYLSDIDDGLSRQIQGLFIRQDSVVRLRATNIEHIFGFGGQSHDITLGSGRIGFIDAHAESNTIRTGTGFIMGISTEGLVHIDIASGCGIGSIFTGYGGEAHLTLLDNSNVDYLQIQGAASDIEFLGKGDVTAIRLDGATVSVGNGSVGSILDYEGGGRILVDNGRIGTIRYWSGSLSIDAGTGSNIDSVYTDGSGVSVKTDGVIKYISSTSDFGHSEIQVGKNGWVPDVWLNGTHDIVSVDGGAGDIHTGAGDDDVSISASGSVELLDLGNGNNVLYIDGSMGAVYAFEGNDSIYSGSFQVEDINAGAGNNIIVTGMGWVGSIDANEGDDLITIGAGGAQQVDGELGNNVITTSSGWVNSISAGSGADRIMVGAGGAGSVMSGNGRDTIDLYGWVGALQAGGGDDKIRLQQDVAKSGELSTFSGGRGSDYFELKPQFDVDALICVYGGPVSSNSERDTVDFGSFDFDLRVALDNSIGKTQNTGAGYISMMGIEDIIGGSGSDLLLDLSTVGEADNNFIGGSGNDSLYGGRGTDTLDGGAGNDSLTGGDGTDTVTYAGTTAAVTVNLALIGAQNTGGAGTDVLTTVENLIGSAYQDLLIGDFNANGLFGGRGSDALIGGGGNDTLDGGAGNDTLDGGAGDDRLVGGSGTDTASYASVGAAVIVNLSLTTAQITGGAGTDTLAMIENITGSVFDDVLTGTAGANRIIGGAGADRITGGDGNDNLAGSSGSDTLVGGAGTDSLNGGAGADLFVFNTTSESLKGAGRDIITDFVFGADKIDLHLIDANTATSGDQAFAFSGATASAFGVWFVNGVLSGDINGDEVPDFEISLNGAVSMDASALIL